MRLISGVAVLLAVALSSEVAARQDEFTALEREATRTMSPDEEFSRRAALVARLESASQKAPNAEQRARLALLWLRSVRWLLSAIPYGGAREQPYLDWAAKHETVVVYSEPAGQWIIVPETVWKTHDAHRSAANAEEIAWFAIENGYPGECEGYVPCYVNTMNWLDGEYLRRHPGGRQASAIVAEIHSGIVRALESLNERFAKDFLNPATDCDDLRKGLAPLREAVLKSNAAERAATIVEIDRLLGRCP